MSNKFILFFLAAFCSYSLLSQDLKTTEIKVVEGFVPEIPEATRLNQKASFQDTVIAITEQEYILVEEKLNSNYKIKPLNPAKVKNEKPSSFNPFEFYLIGGNLVRLKTIYNSTREVNSAYGASMSYNSKLFKVNSRKANSSFSKLHLYFKKNISKHIITTNLDFEKNSGYTYGNEKFIDENNFKTRFSYSKLSFKIYNKVLESKKLKYNTTFFISDLNEFSENRIHLSTLMNKEIKNLPFSVDFQLDNYMNYNSKQNIVSLEAQSIQIISISPSVSLQKFDIDFDVGIDVDYESDGGGLDVFPSFIAKKELVKDILLIAAGIQDNKYRNTFKSLSDENLYIHNQGTNQIIIANDTVLDLKSTEAKEFFVSMKNVLSKDEVFFGKLSLAKIENQQVFELNNNRFLVSYLDVAQLHIESEYERKINNIVDFSFAADYYYWKEKLPHKSNLVIGIASSIDLRNKIILNPSLNYFSKRYDGVDQFLSPIMHINLHVDYKYSKGLTAYLQLKNINNSTNPFWKDYQSIGFHGAFGISYSF